MSKAVRYYEVGEPIPCLPQGCTDILQMMGRRSSEDQDSRKRNPQGPYPLIGEASDDKQRIWITPEHPHKSTNFKRAWLQSWGRVYPKNKTDSHLESVKKADGSNDPVQMIHKFEKNVREVYDDDSEDKEARIDRLILELDQELESLCGGDYRFRLMSTWPFFERFVHMLLREGFGSRNVGYKKRILFLKRPNEPACDFLGDQYIIPDFILSIGERKVILDAKYRPLKGRQGNFYDEQYQISAYMLRIGTDRGILAYPGNLNDWDNTFRLSGDGGSFGIAHCSADPFDRKSQRSFISFVRGRCL